MSLALWTGINVPLLLSMVAITIGTLIFVFRNPIRAWQQRTLPNLSFNALYRWVLSSIDRAAYWRHACRAVICAYIWHHDRGMVALVVGFGFGTSA